MLKRVCIISLTQVTQEPRVLRQIRTFRETGWATSIIGYPGRVPAPSDWEFFDASPPTSEPPMPRQNLFIDANGRQMRFRKMIHKDPSRFARILIQTFIADPFFRQFRWLKQELRMARISLSLHIYDRARAPGASLLMRALAKRLTVMSSRQAHKEYWTYPRFHQVRDSILNKIPPCDLVVGHDYFTYPIAGMLAKKHGARMALDCHEYAREQYDFDNLPDPAQRYDWLFVRRPLSDALQHEYFRKANAVSTVCDGIADLLQEDHRLATRPTVIRSTPFYEELPFRPCGKTIDILYHGLIDKTRNLDVGVRSVALWRPEFRFVIRGPADPVYEAELRALIAKLGLQGRVLIEPPAPFAELIGKANEADVGYFAFENYSKQRQFTAPNKFFEYIMAGLALIVMDTPELAKVVNEYHNGLLVETFDEEGIANVVNSFTPEKINEMKKRSLAAAKELCWERESLKLVSAYGLSC
jgi:glycosyltransferase involved in cell wall biosynthesis